MAVILTASAREQAALRGHFRGKTAVVRTPSSPNQPRRRSVVHGEAVLFFGRGNTAFCGANCQFATHHPQTILCSFNLYTSL